VIVAFGASTLHLLIIVLSS